MRPRRVALGVALSLALAGCGGGGQPTPPPGPDPATLVPSGAPLYLEALVRPEGDQRDALESALSKLLATDDPGGFLVQRLDDALADTGLVYERGVEPWLGARAGIFFETFTEQAADGAGVIATTDAGAAQRAIDTAAAADTVPERPRSYHGVDYQVDAHGNAAGVVEQFVVVGSERAFRDVVDASRGGSLAESASFRAARSATPEDRFAFLYAEPDAIVSALERSGQLSAEQVRSAGPRLEPLLEQPVTASLSATSTQLTFEVSAAAGAAPSPRESPLLEGLPGDSWLAFAGANEGQLYAQAIDSVPVSAGPKAASLRDALGFDLGAELGRWAGDAAAYMRGTSVLGLGGALVVETTDEDASAQTLDELQAALDRDPALDVTPLPGEGEGFTMTPAGSPIGFQIAQRDGKVVAGLGRDSVAQALAPSSRLGDSDTFDAAVGALGEGWAPAGLIDFERLLQLIESLPQAASDPDFQQAQPYLDHLDYLVFGARASGDRAAIRLVLGLREAPNRIPEGVRSAVPFVPAIAR